MIIVEGIDGTGKSTVCKYLESVEGKKIHHLQYSEKTSEGFLNLIANLPIDIVLDRSFISELVYGPILRQYSRIDIDQTKIIVDELHKKDARIIYLKSQKEDLLKRRINNEEDYNLILNYYELLNESYNQTIKKISEELETYTINTSENNIENVKILVKGIIKNEKKR